MSADMSKAAARLHALYDKYRGLQGDMPPFGDVIFLLDALKAATSERAELLAALRGLVDAFRNPGDGGEFEDGEVAVLDRARAALAKAEERR